MNVAEFLITPALAWNFRALAGKEIAVRGTFG
jgi:hypothetical protein